MRILIDTNIFIYREDNKVLPESLQNLLRALNSLKTEIIVHPGSIEELRGDADAGRREIALSKINAYPRLESPPSPERDAAFLERAGRPENPNDRVDNMLLYAVYKDAVDFLITEDRRIHNKAAKTGIKDRVLYIEDAQRVFEKSFPKGSVSHPPALAKNFVYNIDVNDPLFDSLKEEYGKNEFEAWFRDICRKGRECFVYNEPDGKIGALLIYKLEEAAIPILSRLCRIKGG